MVPAEIRVSFYADDGSWSAVGHDALNQSYFPPHQPTMKDGWLRDDTDDEEYQRVVLHEFGHALGMRERQSPTFDREWDLAAVLEVTPGAAELQRNRGHQEQRCREILAQGHIGDGLRSPSRSCCIRSTQRCSPMVSGRTNENKTVAEAWRWIQEDLPVALCTLVRTAGALLSSQRCKKTGRSVCRSRGPAGVMSDGEYNLP